VRVTGALCGFLLLTALRAGAQAQGGVEGRVIDRITTIPVAEAIVVIVEADITDTSDADGLFGRILLPDGTYTIEIRRLGYVGAQWELEFRGGVVLTHDFELEPLGVPLAPAFVTDTAVEIRLGLEGFEERRLRGGGQYMTRAEIERRSARTIGDLLRMLNGLRMACRLGTCRIWMTRWNGYCAPHYFADGIPAPASTVERMPVQDVFGVEVYTFSNVPMEFQRPDINCGVIAIWTRLGPARRR
jgi:hypothetical protein